MSENLALDWTVRRTAGAVGEAAASRSSRSPSNPSTALKSVPAFAFLFIAGVALIFAMIAVHVLEQAVLRHDLNVTAGLLSRAALAYRPARGVEASLADLLDARVDVRRWGMDATEAQAARAEFFRQLRTLPDVKLAYVYAPDGHVIWSTEADATGTRATDATRGAAPFGSLTARMTRVRDTRTVSLPGQGAAPRAAHTYVQNLLPLYGARGDVAASVELYRDPATIRQALRVGTVALWAVIGVFAAGVYIIVVWLTRRLSAAVAHQQQRLVEAEALCVIGEMSAAVAHGIRNPLAAIRSSAELTLEGDLASTRKNAMDIIRQIDRLGLWVKDVLLYSRPMDAVPRPLDVMARTGECLLDISAQLDKAGIDCVWVQPASLIPHVAGDRALTGHAIGNVLANAMEAMPGGGTLQIEFDCPHPGVAVELRIIDTGPGMTAQQLERVFEPCYTTKPNGMGVGMALARRIMERFGGSIRLESRPDRGTTAILSFKAAR